MNTTPRILISIDLEELNLPAKNGAEMSLEERQQISLDGLEKTIALLNRHQVRATFFITASWAQAYPEVVRQLARKHEVASHGYTHDHFSIEDLRQSKDVLEQIIGSRLYGCRMPAGRKPDYSALKAAGYLYHSGDQQVRPMSIEADCYGIYAASIRPLWITKLFLGRQPVISLHFRSWELSAHPISRAANPRLAERLDSVLGYLQRKGLFMPHIEWLQEQLTDE
ncbi:polysaccharide deacetylase family protein [Chitinophaga sp.]|uniref:polysaccharide deacetylase family protein n=1 Tax=Chitinophaga sp. TaxID=1869181 RepID=UPI0031E2D262